MKKRIIILLIASMLLSSAAQAYYRLANARKRGLHVNSIDTVLRLKDDQIDIATAALLLSRDWGTNKTPQMYRRKIDLMAQEILHRLEKGNIPHDHHAIPVINEYLFKEL